MSYCVPPHRVDVSKSFVMPPDVQKEVISLPLQLKQPFASVLLSQFYGYIIYNILEFCSEFRVVDVGFIMDLIRRDYSCRHHLIIQELVSEKSLVP